jgi:hypothetical protein
LEEEAEWAERMIPDPLNKSNPVRVYDFDACTWSFTSSTSLLRSATS